ncbi:MAG: class I tRNA ligase family protein [Bacteroidetes bacterium]|nr:class I tRNA ligase family protein [Bacteroidota bacterium]
MYPEFKQLNLPEIGKEILAFWEKEKVFDKSISTREGKPAYIFYEGPPSANGLPGIHHVMARAIKDIFCRYHTLKDEKVDRKGGWDTHGLPIELSVEKTLGIKKEDIGKKISIEDYNKACRTEVMKYKERWDEVTRIMGYWVDLTHPYITYENSYIESVWWILKELYKKNLLYKGYTIQPYSPAAGTGLSSHELNQPGTYKPIKDTSVVAQFRLIPGPSPKEKGENPGTFGVLNKVDGLGEFYILAWTTTPWTLPSNTALAVGEKITYSIVKTFNPYTHRAINVILAKDLLGKYFPEKNAELKLEDYKQGDKQIPFAIVGEVAGKELVGIGYEQLLPYVQPTDGKAFRVVAGDFVTIEDGTGIVHIAPSFGADDFRVAKQNGIGSLTLVDKRGKFLPEVTDFANEYVKEQYLTEEEKETEKKKQGTEKYLSVDERISIKLKKENKAFKVEKFEHSYPHCWRTDKPILYYPLDSWFVRTTAAKERMIELNNTINWKPESTGTGRFGNWLENLVDWNLSRSRFWGIPLPIWRTAGPDPGPLTPEGGIKPEGGMKQPEGGTKPEEETKPNADGADDEIKCIGSVEELHSEIEKSIAAGFMKSNPVSLTDIDKFDLHKPFIDDVILVSASGKKMERESDLIDVWFDSGAMPYAQWHYPFGPSPLTPEGGTNHERGTNPEGGENLNAVRWKTANPLLYKLLSEHAKSNRNNPTPAEEILWSQLSAKKLSGYKFRRQHIIGDVIPDFVCIQKRLVVEVDGGYHATDEQKQLDAARTEYLNLCGYKVIRFRNEEVIGDIESVLQKIFIALAHTPTVPKSGGFKAPFGGLGAGSRFPADFIAEGVDQTRGWFFTLHAIATMVFDSVAFKNVISNGLVLDKAGNKMSKRLGNAVDPFSTIEKYGPDAVRWYMVTNASPWDNLKFDLEGVAEKQRSFFGTLYNTYSFFALYANIDSFNPSLKSDPAPKTELDRWIISKVHSLIVNVTTGLDNYDPTPVGRAIESFVTEDLSNWYVRLSRRRFWRGEMSEDKQAAYETLHECLLTVAQLMSPIAPFFAEWLYKNLSGKTPENISVHLSYLVEANSAVINKDLEEKMDLAQKITSMILSIRKKENLRVRQPLQRIQIPVLDASFRTKIEGVKDLILTEVNVKELEFVDEKTTSITKNLKLNFKTLGKKYGKLMKAIQQHAADNSEALISGIERLSQYEVNIENEAVVILPEDVEIIPVDLPGWKVANDGAITVALDVTVSPKLKEEGLAREFVNRIQNLRKDKGFEVTDKIALTVLNHPEFKNSLLNNKDYICAEILATSFEIVETMQASGAVTVEVDDTISTLVTIHKN